MGVPLSQVACGGVCGKKAKDCVAVLVILSQCRASFCMGCGSFGRLSLVRGSGEFLAGASPVASEKWEMNNYAQGDFVGEIR